MQQPKPWPGVSSFTCGQVIASNSSPTSTIGWNEQENTKIYERKRVVRKVTETEWAKFVAIILMSSGFEDNGEKLLTKPSVNNFFSHYEIRGFLDPVQADQCQIRSVFCGPFEEE